MATKNPSTEPPVEAAERPPEPTGSELALARSGAAPAHAATELDRPTLEPPDTPAGAAAAATAGMLTNKHVLMLWQTDDPMNAWAYFDGGVGWKQLCQTSEVVTMAIGQLASGARVSGGLVHAYEGAGGHIDAMYLW